MIDVLSIEIRVVGAIRLAIEGAANEETALSLIAWLVARAPASDPRDVTAPRLLLEGVRDLGFSLSTEVPSGAYVPEQALSA